VTIPDSYNSTLAHWKVVEIWDYDIDDDTLAALEKEAARKKDSFIYYLMWNDLFFYHGEDGWCLSDKTLRVCEKWLEAHRCKHYIGDRDVFWVRIKKS
jgi:hypothetical protein